MNREFLKQLGLEDEQIDKIMAEHGKTVNSLKDGADKAEDLQKQIDDYKKELKQRDKQLEELGQKAKGNEELTAQIEELKQQNDSTRQEYENKLQQQQFDFALDKSLSAAKVKNPKAVKALLDMDTIKLDGETLKGLDDQLKSLQESDGYLFDASEGGGDTKPTFSQGEHQKPTETTAEQWVNAFKD